MCTSHSTQGRRLRRAGCAAWPQELLKDVEQDVVVEPFICGEAVFGACCVDDVLSKMLGADAIVHFGHSEIVPHHVVCGKDNSFCALFVPVTSSNWSVAEAHAAITSNLADTLKLCVVSTAQFVAGAREVAQMLRASGRTVSVPTIPGLPEGEILGCTAPTFKPGDVDAIVFVSNNTHQYQTRTSTVTAVVGRWTHTGTSATGASTSKPRPWQTRARPPIGTTRSQSTFRWRNWTARPLPSAAGSHLC